MHPVWVEPTARSLQSIRSIHYATGKKTWRSQCVSDPRPAVYRADALFNTLQADKLRAASGGLNPRPVVYRADALFSLGAASVYWTHDL